MKKKILLSVFTLVVVILTAFTSYKAFGPKKALADLLLDENIEALTQAEETPDYYLHHFVCTMDIATEAHANIISKLLGINVHAGANVDLSKATQYFNKESYQGEGPCLNGVQKTCYDILVLISSKI